MKIAFFNRLGWGILNELIEDKESNTPADVLETLEAVTQNFTGENLIKYFDAIDRWEESLDSEYDGGSMEVLKEDDNGIYVKFEFADGTIDFIGYQLVEDNFLAKKSMSTLLLEDDDDEDDEDDY